MTALRDQAEMAAKAWCICADDYKRRDRIDPTCRCDAMAEAMEEFALGERRQFAQKALMAIGGVKSEISSLRQGMWIAEIGRSQFGIATEEAAQNKLHEFIAAAIAAAEKE